MHQKQPPFCTNIQPSAPKNASFCFKIHPSHTKKSPYLSLFMVKMASSLASIAETWPENVLTSIVCRKSLTRKIMLVPHFRPVRLFVYFRNYNRVRMDFLHEVRFFAGIGPAHFPAAFRMLLCQHSKEGAPFMGTALAEYRQCIGPRLSAIFTFFL